ncbi:putative orfan [Tupanvirus soda lake]|uniref:Orfan n=2 Tax=Tupanvirus TaxID=2094720 RepID=A0AC62AAV6_9VIRU|nr:putative orfan [Tupanvirus soda lake]QKU34834.1 putative orfan [Tupanvirus soda lake]
MERKKNNRKKNTVTLLYIGIHMDTKNTSTKSTSVTKRTEKPKIINVELRTPMARYISGIESVRCESDRIILKTAVSVVESHIISKLARLFFQYYRSPVTLYQDSINEIVPLSLALLNSGSLETLPKSVVATRASLGVIPNEILAHIISFVTPADIFQMARTCKSMYCLMTSNCFISYVEKYILGSNFGGSADFRNRLATIASIYPKCRLTESNAYSIHESIALTFKHKANLEAIEKKRIEKRSDSRRARFLLNYGGRNNRGWHYYDHEDLTDSDDDEIDFLDHGWGDYDHEDLTRSDNDKEDFLDRDEVELDYVNDIDEPDYDYEYERFLQQDTVTQCYSSD